MTYSKEVSINGFSKLSKIEYQTILDWSKNPSCKGFEIYKKIMQENENSNSDLLSSGKAQIGIIARLNHVHNWSAQEKAAQVSATAAALSDTKTAFSSFLTDGKNNMLLSNNETIHDAQ